MPRQGFRCGVVEDGGRCQPKTEGIREASAQFDRCQGIESGAAEGLIGPDVGEAPVPQDAGGVGSDEVDQSGCSIGLWLPQEVDTVDGQLAVGVLLRTGRRPDAGDVSESVRDVLLVR